MVLVTTSSWGLARAGPHIFLFRNARLERFVQSFYLGAGSTFIEKRQEGMNECHEGSSKAPERESERRAIMLKVGLSSAPRMFGKDVFHGLDKASTFAAIIKSFSESPRIEWVVNCTSTLPQATFISG